MALVDAEYIDGTLRELYPDGVGTAHGKPRWAPTKTADRARVKVCVSYVTST